MPRALNEPVGCIASIFSQMDLPRRSERARDSSSGVSMNMWRKAVRQEGFDFTLATEAA